MSFGIGNAFDCWSPGGGSRYSKVEDRMEAQLPFKSKRRDKEGKAK